MKTVLRPCLNTLSNYFAMHIIKTSDAIADATLAKATGEGFIASTPVHTDKGLVPIEQIKVGDYVLSQPEGGGEKAYKKVLKTFEHEDKEVWVVKYTTGDENKPTRDDMILHLYATANHPFWVNGVGWTSAKQLKDGHRFQVAAGCDAQVVQVWPVLRTPVPGLGWVSADILGSYDALELAHVVDFRNGCNLWQYPMFRRVEASVPYFEGFLFDETEGLFDGQAMYDICFGGKGLNYKSRVYNLEIEDFHTYYIGEIGVLV
ncbi:MAG: HINT domain-containing protein [Rhodocyclales bacterium]|nr:HINT domain-containing protein [Rhodocyclales bacterium]